jgi:hypothetical protein
MCVSVGQPPFKTCELGSTLSIQRAPQAPPCPPPIYLVVQAEHVQHARLSQRRQWQRRLRQSQRAQCGGWVAERGGEVQRSRHAQPAAHVQLVQGQVASARVSARTAALAAGWALKMKKKAEAIGPVSFGKSRPHASGASLQRAQVPPALVLRFR